MLSSNCKSSNRNVTGASDGNRTHVSALARPRTSRCTTPACKNIITYFLQKLNYFSKNLYTINELNIINIKPIIIVGIV